jgi:hypothetical protein
MDMREKVFKDLRERDPDGWETRPNEDDYAEFKAYAVRKYDVEWWRRYKRA